MMSKNSTSSYKSWFFYFSVAVDNATADVGVSSFSEIWGIKYLCYEEIGVYKILMSFNVVQVKRHNVFHLKVE